MAEMIADMQRRYSLIIVVAPPLTEWDNLDMAIRNAKITYPILSRDAKDAIFSLTNLRKQNPCTRVLFDDINV